MTTNINDTDRANPVTEENPGGVALPPTLQVEVQDSVAVLRICRAAKRNALNDGTILGLEAFFTAPPRGSPGGGA